MRRSTTNWAIIAAAVLAVVGLAGLAGSRAQAHPHEEHGWLGVTLGGGGEGVTILGVLGDSPAEQAGIEEGDRVVALDGEDIADLGALVKQIKSHEPGDTVELTLEGEGGEVRRVAVTLGTPPEDRFLEMIPGLGKLRVPGHDFKFTLPDMDSLSKAYGLRGSPRAYLGVELTNTSDQLRDYFGATSGQGVLVNRVLEDTPAAAAGLRAGDLLLKVDGEPVADAGDVIEALSEREPEDTVSLTVLRDRATREMSAVLDENPNPFPGKLEFYRFEGDPDDSSFHFEFDDEAREELRKAVRESLSQSHEAWREAMDAYREAMQQLRQQMQQQRSQVHLQLAPLRESQAIRELLRKQMREHPEGASSGRVLHI